MSQTTLKTLCVGHTFTLCDLFFGAIENKSYKKNCFTQKDWEQIMESCKCSVISMTQDFFYNWNWLEKCFKQQR